MPIQGEGVGRISKDQGVMQELRPKRGKGAGKERSEGRAPRQRESERVETLVGQGGGKAFALHSIQGPACSGVPGVSRELLGPVWELERTSSGLLVPRSPMGSRGRKGRWAARLSSFLLVLCPQLFTLPTPAGSPVTLGETKRQVQSCAGDT